MPTVSVGRDNLFRELGKVYTDEEFEDLCFEFGIELDDVTTEKEMVRKELGLAEGQGDADLEDEIIYKIDIPANRYDLLCLEGISRALRVFLGKEEMPTYKVVAGGEIQTMRIKPETALIRPHVVCATLRGVTFTKESYQSFIDLQDKLHQNLCRQRTLVAIGTHDLDTLKGPFRYEALPPEKIVFTPLKQTRDFNAKDLMEFYKSDQKLKQYLHIIEDSPVFPVIYDSNGTVLSLPPIINGAHSAITLDTKNVFIECTATDHTKANIVLNTVVTMFSQYCSQPFVIEPVNVIDQFEKERVYPNLGLKEFKVTEGEVCKAIGVDVGAEKIASLLRKMQLLVEPSGSGDLLVKVPPTRSDILHACDIYEDVAIAWGYNNIVKEVPQCMTMGKEFPLNQLSDMLRNEMALIGFTEILTFGLCSHEENFTHLRREHMKDTAVTVGNPKTLEFELCRTSLLPCALKTLAANKDAPVPVKLFELSDVILVSEEHETGAKNERRLIALYSGKDSGFEVVHGTLNRIMEILGVPVDLEGDGSTKDAYSWKESEEKTFFPGRQAIVSFKGKEIGIFGVIHPEVLKNFDIVFPCSAFELNIEPFCYDQFGNCLLV
ncbi:beta subunit of phenylalanine--tRNA ligase [Chloropicon primus]|uniref:phenylalanine--tRNA ligase n=1 Tax=Chloropicon primus TaxID=1764295 RepID=A0A5B8ME91_9CHLO|nr:beta subunit of phenylalanine--tRNA ligase [Chloropicon primus]UPQ98146.1 beta subunit of phenylalanine--tRNA ligase [Chloropicon primus]|eukprot:QDZ18938.1 beta subunit of phenylalanine--tRNA ligase [Chloropicon primus]